jgi:DNA-binding transcriptional regulator YdaS (Cro superfamily)
MTNQTDPIKAAVTLLGGQANTARKLAVSAGLVWQWVNGKRPVGPAHCPVQGLARSAMARNGPSFL